MYFPKMYIHRNVLNATYSGASVTATSKCHANVMLVLSMVGDSSVDVERPVVALYLCNVSEHSVGYRHIKGKQAGLRT
jgi:hypothetical protein